MTIRLTSWCSVGESLKSTRQRYIPWSVYSRRSILRCAGVEVAMKYALPPNTSFADHSLALLNCRLPRTSNLQNIEHFVVNVLVTWLLVHRFTTKFTL